MTSRIRPVLCVVALTTCLAAQERSAPSSGSHRSTNVPLGLDLVAPEPADNRLTAEKVELGRRLFFDPVLSRDRSVSCSTCHRPDRYFTDGRARGHGVDGQVGRRNVPSVLNAAYGRTFFWDGRAPSLEAQALQPIQDELEMDLELDELERRLRGEEVYVSAFRRAFEGEAVSADNVARALASYVRTLRSGDAPIDRYLAGDDTALSAEAQRGLHLFTGRANCSSCHLAPLFTDHQFHNTGVSWGSGDVGRQATTGRDEDGGAFKVPSLRNVAQTAPYMHDGSLATLDEVIDFYDRGGGQNPDLDEEIRPLGLSGEERSALRAFLAALTGDVQESYTVSR